MNSPSLQIQAKLGFFMIWFGFAFSLLFSQKEGAPTFVLHEDNWVVEVRLSNQENSSERLQVFVGENPPSAHQPPVLGSVHQDKGVSRFIPKFPLQAGITYRAVYGQFKPTIFQIPRPKRDQPLTVSAIYPSVDTVPANLLKMYLHFSAPMRQGVAYEHLHVWEQEDQLLPSPFLQLQPELWDSSGKILTLWLDPGRIKRDLGPNQEWGPPLEEGKWYTLRIDSSWTDLDGYALDSTIFKTFYVRANDRHKPLLDQWVLDLPTAGSQDPLLIDFGEPMDHTLLRKALQIIDATGIEVIGQFLPVPQETALQFTPDQVWSAQRYQIQIESRLEDLAGNNLNRLFDQEVGGYQPTKEVYLLEFIVE